MDPHQYDLFIHKQQAAQKIKPVQDGVASHPFDKARDDFLSSLSTQDRSLYPPCATATDLADAIKKLGHLTCRRLPLEDALQVIDKLGNAFKPFFDVVAAFVSSNPQYAALLWGSMLLLFKLASNFVTFFQKLLPLLDSLSRSFMLYEDVWKLCRGWKDQSSRIPEVMGKVYSETLQIFHAAVKVFTKGNGKLKRTPIVIGELMWKPFDSRLNDMLYRLGEYRREIFQEIHIQHSNALARQEAQAEAEREIFQEEMGLTSMERQKAARERQLSSKERELACLERQQALGSREHVRITLRDIRSQLNELHDIRTQLNELGKQHKENAYEGSRQWIHPPSFLNSRDQARDLRAPGTANWIFEDPTYLRWIKGSLDSGDGLYQYGCEALWINGNPGSGKTVLAASIIDQLENDLSQDKTKSRQEVFYYFFDSKSKSLNTHSAPTSAYRSILAQLLSRNADDTEILDKFKFVQRNEKGQMQASDSEIIELLRLCLDANSILILDGIDECDDSEKLVSLMLEIWKESRPRVVFLSRINVEGLKRSIPAGNQMAMSRDSLSRDIQKFSEAELGILFDRAILPRDDRQHQEALAKSCFTDYAAAAWIDHVSTVVNTSHDPGYPGYSSSLIYQFYSPEFLNLLSRFITDLTAWLRTPAALSAWLEAFYTTQYHADYEHPNHQTLYLLGVWLGKVSQQYCWLPMAAELPRDIMSLSSELREISETWKDRLKESPGRLIWDEMTGFLQRSSFFYRPDSVKVMYQTVLSPQGEIHSSNPTLQMSKTSDSGDFKGVLSIWAPPAFSLSNAHLKTMARSAGVFNLFSICTGWVATYEVWTLHPQAAQAARVELSIDSTAMLLPIHTYLSHHSSTEIDIHLNVAPDVASFIIVRSSQGLSFEWSASKGDERPAIHTSYFSPDSQTLGLLEWMPSGAQHLSVFELIKDRPALELNPLGTLEFVPGINRIKELIFHPHQCIVAFCVYDKLNHKNTAYLRRKFNTTWVLRRSPKVYLVGLSHSRASHLFGSGAVSSTIDVCPQEGTVELSVDASAKEVQMSLTNISGIRQTARLVSLPTWIGAEHTTQRIVLPRFAGDTLKISVDVDPRASYKHSEYSLGSSPVVPAVIERDVSYVELGPTAASSDPLSRLLRNSTTEARTGQKRSYSQARLQEDERLADTLCRPGRPPSLRFQDNNEAFVFFETSTWLLECPARLDYFAT
ncbi:hypothetical protein INS49_003613 [Diaporthe citri]|uniref:uncharacterized protein n=1 Tax=Diaporthe citri TaxID=83186 RepID=UPI001C80B762|nr:uncharacterized protein INS49_003613 [Diaporthe citri]KAG6355651.1 hypothetical protein INS49_003613 [Diaporthe citri]